MCVCLYYVYNNNIIIVMVSLNYNYTKYIYILCQVYTGINNNYSLLYMTQGNFEGPFLNHNNDNIIL